MAHHHWRISPLSGPRSVWLSEAGIGLGDRVRPWSELSDVAFVRYQVRGGVSEELWLSFGPAGRHRLHWMGHAGRRAEWKAMLLDFTALAARRRPDLTLRDGPDRAERRAAAPIGLWVAALSLCVMAVVLASGPSVWGGLVAVWIGVVGSTVGGVIWRHYTRKGDAPRIDWADFAAREGQDGELPVN